MPVLQFNSSGWSGVIPLGEADDRCITCKSDVQLSLLSDNSFRVTRPSITVVHSNPKSHRIPPGGGGYVILPNSFYIKQNDNTGERAACYFAVNFFEACSLVKNKRHYLNIMNGRNELLNDFY